MVGEYHRREAAIQSSGVLRLAQDSDLAAIVAFAAAKHRAPMAGLSIITGRRQVVLSVVGTDVVETGRADSFCATTIRYPGEVLVVADAATDKRFSGLSTVMGEPYVRFYAGVAILDRNGYALGALCVADHVPRFDGVDVAALAARGREVERLLRW